MTLRDCNRPALETLQVTNRALQNSLVLDLEVEVSREPVVEEALRHVGGGDGLRDEPRLVALLVDLHREVRHLRHECEPEAVEHPVRKRSA